MAKNNNIIEINGKRYDAKTGALLAIHSKPTHLEPKTTANKKPPATKKPSMHDVIRHPAKPAAAHQPTPSKTLMRQAVKKPSPAPKQKLKAQGPSDLSTHASLAEVVVNKSAKSLDKKKLAKASTIPKSHLITHFSATTSDVNSPEPSPTSTKTEMSPPIPISHSAKSAKLKPQTTSELLEHAVNNAKSHEEPAPKLHRRGKRRTRAAIASAVAIALFAFVGYQELPTLKFNMASAKAGFGATMPSYKPAGYSLNKLSYSSGVIATKFTSNSDDRSYTLTQKTSNWNSQALKENFVVKTSSNYQVVETGGQTIYLYGSHNATWVNGGVWYIVQGNDTLTNRQLVEIAKSI